MDPPSNRLPRYPPRLRLPHPRHRYLFPPPFPQSSHPQTNTPTLTPPPPFLLSSLRPLLPLRTSRRAHRPREETPHPTHLQHHHAPNPPHHHRPLPAIPIRPQHRQPCRLRGQPAPFPHRKAIVTAVHSVLQYVSLSSFPSFLPVLFPLPPPPPSTHLPT